MTSIVLDRLIAKGREGILNETEQLEIANELAVYRAMAMRLERALHDLVKEVEGK